MKRIAVVGSTGSIGKSTLDVIAQHPERLQLAGLAVRTRIDLLAEQARAFKAPHVVVWEEDQAARYAKENPVPEVWSGIEGLIRLVTHPSVDTVVFAASGSDTLIPLIRAISAGKHIALASKELLVMAGEWVMRLVREHGTSLVPVDSEHAALFQCLQGVSKDQVSRLIVTGSGGPLWGRSAQEMAYASREQVLAHPKWQMGPKITVDSATLMNKGLELIEAQWLFGMPLERLAVVIHPEAVVHALVEMADGSLMAQLSPCDMRLPIQYALSFPERWPSTVFRLPLTQLSGLRFYEPDLKQFPCLALALQAAKTGGTACAALNGANEAAVRAYLDNQLSFSDIPRVIGEVMEQHTADISPSLDDILKVDAWARLAAQESIAACSPS